MSVRRAGFVFVLLLATPGCRTPAPAKAPEKRAAVDFTPPTLRPPPGVWPTRGELDLTVLPDQTDFEGTAKYALDVKAEAGVVWLNATELVLDGASFTVQGRVLPAKVIPGNVDFVGLVPAEPLVPGSAEVSVHFRGKLDRTRSRGLYAAQEGAAWYAYTFFEPVDARRAFPCFDVPSAKIPWRLTLRVHPSEVAAANAPMASEKSEGGLKVVRFEESAPLPSYLVAFMVGPFDVIKAGTAGHHGTPLRFIVPKGRGAETAYAQSVTPKIISLLEDYFGMEYPFRKLDVAVVPRFWGTMEHPGLVALGQPLTLIKPAEDSTERREAYANIAIHELAHFWFGDYVTCAWWDDTWLNESLGTWLDLKLTDQLEPAWKLGLRSVQQVSGAMNADSLPGAKRLREPVLAREDIEASFDNDITYSKGASVMEMYERAVGEVKFQSFIRQYLHEHAFGVATSADFVATMRRVLGPEIATSFESFLSQPGAPRITSELDCKDPSHPVLVLTQERYKQLGMEGVADEQWSVPVSYAVYAGGKVARGSPVLHPAQERIPLALAACPKIVNLKQDGRGYFRAAYPKGSVRAELFAPSSPLSLSEKLAMLGDFSGAVRHGDLTRADLLTLIPALARSPDDTLVATTASFFGGAQDDQVPTALRPRWEAFIRKAFGDRFRSLGLKRKADDTPEQRLLRPALFDVLALRGGDVALQREARHQTDTWLENKPAMEPEMRDGMLFVAAVHGDEALLGKLLTALHTEKDPSRRSLLFRLLGLMPPPLDVRVHELLRDPKTDAREAAEAISAGLTNLRTREGTWSFVQEQFDVRAAQTRADDIGQLVLSLGAVFCDPVHEQAMNAFFRPRLKSVDGGPRTLDKAVQTVHVCAAQAPRNRAALEAFFAQGSR